MEPRGLGANPHSKGCKTTASKMLKRLEAAEKIEEYGRMDTKIKKSDKKPKLKFQS